MTRLQNTLGTLGLLASLTAAPALAQDSGLFDWDSYDDDSGSGSTSTTSSSGTDISDAETSPSTPSQPVFWKTMKTSATHFSLAIRSMLALRTDTATPPI